MSKLKSTTRLNLNLPSEDVVSSSVESPASTPNWDWQARRQLLQDICQLSPVDLPGLFLRFIHESRRKNEPEDHREIQIWENPRAIGEVVKDIVIDVDQFQDRPTFLQHCREYVDACYHPHVLTRGSECNICEGLWAAGPVIRCSNDFCSTRVHASCFGVIETENADGLWKCPSCASGQALTCALCMQSGGALKRIMSSSVDDNKSSSSNNQLMMEKWAHVLCALVVPETSMCDNPSLEPIEGLDLIPNNRFRYLCAVCRVKGGVCLVCDHDECNVGCHPKCAADVGLLVGKNNDRPFSLFCDKHLPPDRTPGAKRWVSEQDCLTTPLASMSSHNSHDQSGPHEDEEILAKTYFKSEEHQKTENIQSRFSARPAHVRIYNPRRTYGASPRTMMMVHHESSRVTTPREKTGLASNHMTGQALANSYSSSSTEDSRTNNTYHLNPLGRELVGTVVEIFWKKLDQWLPAVVKDWSSRNRNHLLHYYLDGYEEWVRMRSHNTRVLRYVTQNTLRIKLHRVKRPDGVLEWRPKPQVLIDPPSDKKKHR